MNESFVAVVSAQEHRSDRLYAVSGCVYIALGILGALWGSLISHLINVLVVKPAWPPACLPYENVFYLMFSTSVADILQSLCLISGGLRLLFVDVFPTLLHKLFYLLLVLSRSARVLLLWCICVRLWQTHCWSHPLKVTLVSMLWTMATIVSFLLCYQCAAEELDVTSANYYPPLSWWRYVVLEFSGLLLVVVLVAIPYGFRARTDRYPVQAGELHDSTSMNQQLKQCAEQAFNNPTQDNLRSLGELKRQIYLKDWNSRRVRTELPRATPSRFNANNLWSLERTFLDDNSECMFDYVDSPSTSEGSRHCVVLRVSEEGVLGIRRRLVGFVIIVTVIQGVFSALSLGIHVVAVRLWHNKAMSAVNSILVAEEVINVQPVLNAIVFTAFFSRFYKYLHEMYTHQMHHIGSR